MMGPEPVSAGTAVVRLVAVTADTVARLTLNERRSLVGTKSKFVPVTLTVVGTEPIAGVKLVTVGTPVAPTVNAVELVAEPLGAETPMEPVVAPDGTVTTNWVAVADETVAEVPLKVTVFWLVVPENPVPRIVTVVPTGPLGGENEMIEACDEAWRPIEVTLPTAS